MHRINLCATILLCSLSLCSNLDAQTTPDYKSNPKFQFAIAEGKQLEQHRQLSFALDAYKKANKIADGKDADTLDEIFSLQLKIGSYKDAVATAPSLESAATTPKVKISCRGQPRLCPLSPGWRQAQT